ncbi:MAG: hypothetical protein RMK94_13010 [Armatimonadota bacterium]|nr:hypothetical protein [Armatimonadota bacterium]
MVAVEIYELIVKIDGFPVINKLNLLINEGDSIDISCENFPLTLLRILCGFELPDIGEIWFYNLPPRQAFLRSLISLPMLSGSNLSQCCLQPQIICVTKKEEIVNIKVSIDRIFQ